MKFRQRIRNLTSCNWRHQDEVKPNSKHSNNAMVMSTAPPVSAAAMGQTPSSVFTPNVSTTSTSSGRRRSFRSPFSRRKKYQKPLSATFNVPNYNAFDLLNINLATAEQFMTLPGINRRIAQTIVDHRNALGGSFQRIDDLALVSGIGAEKLEQIRPEISIKTVRANYGNGSSMSSRTQSLDSVLSDVNNASYSTARSAMYNVNTSTVFQLQQINGMNQELAANLVEYRTRKGPFKSLDDLVKVKGLSQSRLYAIKPSLCCNDSEIPRTPRFNKASPSISTCTADSSIPPKHTSPCTYERTNSAGHRKSISMPVCQANGFPSLPNGFANVPVNDIFDLLGAYSHRPSIEDSYNNTRNGHSSIRLATWNLHRMCAEKASNLGVREVVCRTILENRLSIVCVQEVLSPLALQAICDELNRPRLRRVIEWKANTRNWKYLASQTCANGQLSGLGFVYDADRCDVVRDECFDISLKHCVNGDDPNHLTPSAYVASFRMTDWTCHVLNTYLRYYDLTHTDLVIKSVEAHLKKHSATNSRALTVSDLYFVAGDFTGTTTGADSDQLLRHNHSAPNKRKEERRRSSESKVAKHFDLAALGFHSICPPNSTSSAHHDATVDATDEASQTKATTSNGTGDVASSCNILCHDRMPTTSTRSAFRAALYSNKSPFNLRHDLALDDSMAKEATPSTQLCGYWAIVKQGLCHMAIPRNYTWGGAASEHCPVWVEMYKQQDRASAEQLNGSAATIDDLNASTVSAGSLDAQAKRQLFQQRRNSLKSNGSYTRMMNGMHLSAPATAATNGDDAVDINASNDSVFLNGI